MKPSSSLIAGGPFKGCLLLRGPRADNESETNGGSSGYPDGGSCSGSDCDTYSYVQAVNAEAQALCGARDWRMPWLEELRSIVNNGAFNLTIDSAYFPLQRSGSYWSGSPNAGYFDSSWRVQFRYGDDGTLFRGAEVRVRLVRVGQ